LARNKGAKESCFLIRSNFIKTTYDISLDSQISFLPLGFSPPFLKGKNKEMVKGDDPKGKRQRNLVMGIERDVKRRHLISVGKIISPNFSNRFFFTSLKEKDKRLEKLGEIFPL